MPMQTAAMSHQKLETKSEVQRRIFVMNGSSFRWCSNIFVTRGTMKTMRTTMSKTPMTIMMIG